MDVDPDELLVTTGGQQVIDLVCKTLRRSRRRGRRRGAHLPGRGAHVLRLPGRRRAGDDGPRRDAGRRARADARPSSSARAPAQVHLHGPQLPQPGRRDDVAGSAASGWCEIAGERELLVLEDNPYGLLRYEGTPLPTLHSLEATSSSSTRARSRRSSLPGCDWAGQCSGAGARAR